MWNLESRQPVATTCIRAICSAFIQIAPTGLCETCLSLATACELSAAASINMAWPCIDDGSPRHPKMTNSFSYADGIRGCCAGIRTGAGTLRSGFSDGRRLKEHRKTLCEAVGLRNLSVNRPQLQRRPPKAAEGKGDKFLLPGCQSVRSRRPDLFAAVSCLQILGRLSDP